MWEKWPLLNEARIRFLKFLRHVPLVGALVTCRLKDHFNASAEFFSTIALGTMPLWLSGLYGSIYNVAPEKKSYLYIWRDVILSGELYLYCASFLAPIFYIALTERKGDKPFPSKLSFMFSTTIILIMSAFLFTIARNPSTYDASLFTKISVILFFFSAILLYLATVYRNFKTFDFTEQMTKEEDDFTDELLASRGQK